MLWQPGSCKQDGRRKRLNMRLRLALTQVSLPSAFKKGPMCDNKKHLKRRKLFNSCIFCVCAFGPTNVFVSFSCPLFFYALRNLFFCHGSYYVHVSCRLLITSCYILYSTSHLRSPLKSPTHSLLSRQGVLQNQHAPTSQMKKTGNYS